jgi:hypothetical protein
MEFEVVCTAATERQRAIAGQRPPTETEMAGDRPARERKPRPLNPGNGEWARRLRSVLRRAPDEAHALTAICKQTGLCASSASNLASKMVARGEAVRVGVGLYQAVR